MGAEQSTTRNGEAAGSTARKTCYYEVLGIERTAPDEDIRRAYKKKALELHPDRNIDDVENATRKFAEVQTAYEVLSDPQERAWYDSHRDAILDGDTDGGGGGGSTAPGQSPGSNTPAQAIFSLMGRFNSSVPLDNSPRGFFGILNAFFDQLAAEETAACEWDGIIPQQYPPFGEAQDDYNKVAKPFYNVWSSFSTRKSFSWMDKYRVSEAPDRRVRRLMEKENKKFRDEGIREFNDAVLSLVAFVKKRDPRYVPSTQSEAERQQLLRNSALAQAARSRAANLEKMADFVVPDWARSRNDEDQDDEFSLSEEESETEQIECVVCNKVFKSENQFQAHEKSKKHTKAVQQLRREMKRDQDILDIGDTEVPSTGTPAQKKDLPSVPGNPDEDIHKRADEPQIEPAHDGQKLPENGQPPSSGSDDGEFDDEYAPRHEVESRFAAEGTAGVGDNNDPDVLATTAAVENMSVDGTRKAGKAKQKREKKAARDATAENVQATSQCAVCKEVFSSRSKLFDHIRQEGHAAPVAVASQKSKGGRKQKR